MIDALVQNEEEISIVIAMKYATSRSMRLLKLQTVCFSDIPFIYSFFCIIMCNLFFFQVKLCKSRRVRIN